MRAQSKQEQKDETDGVVRLPDTLVAEILAMIREQLQDDLPQLHYDPWAANQRRRGSHLDP